jgi:hypothetical protein
MLNTFWRYTLEETTIEQIIKEGGTVIILETVGSTLSVSIAGDPTSMTGLTAHGMVEAYMHGEEYESELFRLEPQGNA